jgi:uncharacterized membrane protein
MWNLEVGFDRPIFLLLLILLPLLWIFSLRSLSSLGTKRRIVALLLRSLVMTCLILALAEVQLQKSSDKVTVIYLLDQSDSIPSLKRELMLDYVVREVQEHRRANRNDRAGIIVFGRDAVIEVPPFDDDIPDTGSLESFLEQRDATNLEAALKLAQATFPEDAAKRIVIVSDGNENVGNARSVSPSLASNGVGIDVVPVQLTTRAEVAVEKVTLPTDIRRGTPFEVQTILNNLIADGQPDAEELVGGKLRLTRMVGGREELVAEERVELPPGKSAIGFRTSIESPAMYTYQATFVPDDVNDDLMPQNNQASAFTYVRGKGRILVIEDCDHVGEFDFFIERLRDMNLEIDVQPSNRLFSSLPELQAYDCVVLANVPRSSGDDAANVSSFRDEQIEMLVRNTQNLGAGLIMLGGPQSFGAGGWANTELEKAMPVDFQIKNDKIEAVGALVLMMHASEMADGNYWQKVVAREAIRALGPMDYCGLIHWNNLGGNAWLWGGQQGLIQVTGKRRAWLARLNRMVPGDMPEFDPSMKMALSSFNRVNASIKHMIIISDGDPSPPFNSTVSQYRQAGIKISTVAVGTHGPPGSTPMEAIATATGGQYYVVKNPKALPKIYQREARRVSKPLVKDLNSVVPQVTYPHEILDGIEGPLPPLDGMVLTTVKENPLVEVAVRSPIPSAPENSTILAAWTYGLGRTAVVTTDAGHRWANAWTQWEGYDKFYSQLVRWAMRPTGDEGKYTVATEVRGDQVRVVITALDPNDEFRNFLNMTGVAIGPDLEPLEFKVEQEASGRYVSEFQATKSGSYHLTIVPNPGEPPIMAGISVPYSDEFRVSETNVGLLESLVSVRPDGGQPGEMTATDLDQGKIDDLLSLDTFRPDLPEAISIQDVWPLVVLFAAGLFFTDVFVRRVTVSFAWIWLAGAWLRTRLLRRGDSKSLAERLEQLRQKKAEVAETMDQRRAASRFESPTESPPDEAGDEALAEMLPGGDAAAKKAKPAAATPPQKTIGEATEKSYTDRLLEAKKQAQAQHRKKKEDR